MLERYERVYITENRKQDKIKSYKLRKHFDNTVLDIMSNSTKKLIAWKKGDMSLNVASCLAKENVKKSNDVLWDCAEMLQNEILQSQSNAQRNFFKFSMLDYLAIYHCEKKRL